VKITSKSGVWVVGLLVLIVLRGERCGQAHPPVSTSGDAPSRTQEIVDGMVMLPAGVYIPLYNNERGEAQIAIKAFYLDTYAVTNAQYLAFVQANAQWRRSRVPRLFADPTYLSHWPSDLPPPEASVAWRHSPVTSVSWFAARAYCAWQQKRLPRVAEWEYVALASDRAPDGRHDPAFMSRLLEWYTRPSLSLPPPVGSGAQNYWGVYDLHGIIWEWVVDFQTALVTGESRGDGDLERNCGAGMVGTAPQERMNYPAFMRYAYRSSLRGTYTISNLGFRCAKDPP